MHRIVRSGWLAGGLGFLGAFLLLAARECALRGRPVLLREPLVFAPGGGHSAGLAPRMDANHVLCLELTRREAPAVERTEADYWEAPPHEGEGIIDPAWRVLGEGRELGSGSWRENALRLAPGRSMAFGAFQARRSVDLRVEVHPGEKADLLEAAGAILEVRVADEAASGRMAMARNLLGAAGVLSLAGAAWSLRHRVSASLRT